MLHGGDPPRSDDSGGCGIERADGARLGALAYASAHAQRRSPFTLAACYVAGKLTVYTLAGGLIVLAGLHDTIIYLDALT